jgi:nucleotide-binding universal stress UspA family protein
MAIERGCDLIAASAARSSILKDVLLGNTVTSLVRASDMDVLVVPK